MVKEIFTANHKDEIGLCKSTMTQSCYPPPEQKYDVFKIHSQLLGMQTCTYLIGSACCTSLWWSLGQVRLFFSKPTFIPGATLKWAKMNKEARWIRMHLYIQSCCLLPVTQLIGFGFCCCWWTCPESCSGWLTDSVISCWLAIKWSVD